ncbi:MAG TPA: UDP-3-O-(3-hydroxymyristoyl)glucosamine N-acyltransferase [Arachidicoccus sp.]|nr:UDP-3-O-(3-hydroxymyristoyl)glucosamine N-acyltransferase [Arachidicoccus sp.]
MQFPQPVTVKWIAALIGAEIIGDPDAQAIGINELHKVKTGDLVFVDHPKYYDTCLKSVAGHVIINQKEVANPKAKTLLYVEEPFEAYLKIVEHFRPFTKAEQLVNDAAVIGEDTVIMPGVFIGKSVKIGTGCIIHPNVTILDYTTIGDNVIIQSGTVIGSDAFYYNTRKSNERWYKKMQSCGDVFIEDFVEIGANCTIDRGVTATTRIGSGTKIDNLVHIGHDTQVGRNCLFAAQVGIAGAAVIEDGVTLWGQVGVNKTLTIGAGATVLGQSGVPSSLKGDMTYFGYPVAEASLKRKELVWVKRIPEIWKKVFGEEEQNPSN